MGRVHDSINERLAEWVTAQPVFFVATAPLAADGHVNCSPKGNRGTFAVIDHHTVAYLDLTGSGVETVAHLRENGRIVVMFCAFDGPPRIVRFHGRGEVVASGDGRFAGLAAHFPGHGGARAVISVAVDRVSDSCGYNVPFLRFESDRATLDEWTERKGPEGIAAYHEEKNAVSIDGLPGLPGVARTAGPVRS